MNIRLKNLRKAFSGMPAQYLVLIDNREVGTLEKFRNSADYTHPWKAFAGIGEVSRFLGAFLVKQAAIAAIVAASMERLTFKRCAARRTLPKQ